MKKTKNGTHGGLDYAKLREKGISPDEITDFSVSINPFPVHKKVLSAVKSCNLTRYPDSVARELRESIADYEGCTPDEILAVNGTSQGIHLIGQAFLDEKSNVLISGPAYSQYRKISELRKSSVEEITSLADDDFRPPVERIITKIKENRPGIFWICNPNNPTGTYVVNEDLKKIESAAVESGTIVIIDEAYVAFTRDSIRFRDTSTNILRLNSMTKDYGIPGLRLGYIHGDPKLIGEIARYQPEWSISAPAQRAGIACLKERDYYKSTWKKVRNETDRFRNELVEMGLKVYHTESNFFMAKLGSREYVPEGMEGYAALLQKKLEPQLMQIRDCTSFGLPDHIRIGVHNARNNNRLLEAMREARSIWE
ncbi:pyridoxal phosphate-dependent aminotransferase [Spirochaeta isovalerica]|uniref:Aminotransferase n=1 Tax=Spirochaeta isovalerica TaxID=150 RepID=A0A841R9C8_9SPIO|nr:histidinol-phosphate transaminase [Spirochaeta isovalerica]MBB6479072.1 histidinol-phosphate aminotransferase [Spirochaeta isovalerica]